MKSLNKSWALAAILVAALASILTPRAAAQNDGVIRGQIMDIAGKPWADLPVQAVNEQGVKVETKTDKDGNYMFRNLRTGIYVVRVILPAPNPPYESNCRVQGGVEARVDLNFKDIAAKQELSIRKQRRRMKRPRKTLRPESTRGCGRRPGCSGKTGQGRTAKGSARSARPAQTKTGKPFGPGGS